MYELIILSLLMRQPLHGYLIAKAMNNVIGPVAKASNGRIYPLLAKLQSDGLVASEEMAQDGRQIRTFRITDLGRQRFKALMMDTSTSLKEYHEIFSFKASVLHYLTQEERLSLISHYAEYCKHHLMHIERGLKEMSGNSPGYDTGERDRKAFLRVLNHRLRRWHLELEWVEELARIGV